MTTLALRHGDIADAVLSGATEVEIAERVGKPLEYVQGVTRSPMFRALLTEAERERVHGGVRRARVQLADALPDAVQVLHHEARFAEGAGHRITAAKGLTETSRHLLGSALDTPEVSDDELDRRLAEIGARTLNAIATVVEPVRIRTLDEALAAHAAEDEPA